MKRLLIIDDNKDRWKATVAEFPHQVSVDHNIDNYFEYDQAGTFCNKKPVLENYEYIFIHHSQQGDSLIPSSLLDLIKAEMALKLVLFSGSITENMENIENTGFSHRSIERGNLKKHLSKLVKGSVLIGRWEIQMLYFSFPKSLYGKIMEMLDDEVELEDIFNSIEMKELLILTHVKVDSKRYADLKVCDRNHLLDKLKDLIE